MAENVASPLVGCGDAVNGGCHAKTGTTYGTGGKIFITGD
jgi:hypothetical protein